MFQNAFFLEKEDSDWDSECQSFPQILSSKLCFINSFKLGGEKKVYLIAT
jgi:hypothetical protein